MPAAAARVNATQPPPGVKAAPSLTIATSVPKPQQPAPSAPTRSTAAASDNLTQVQYYKRARIAPLLNNLCRQLLLEGPADQVAVLECLVRSLASIQTELDQGTPLGRELRFTMLPMPSAQGRVLVRRRARERAAAATEDDSGSPARGGTSEEGDTTTHRDPVAARDDEPAERRPSTVPTAAATVQARPAAKASDAAGHRSGDDDDTDDAAQAQHGHRVASTHDVEQAEQHAAASRIQRSWRSRHSALNRTQCTDCTPGVHDAAWAMELGFAAILVQRGFRRWDAQRRVARLHEERARDRHAADRAAIVQEEATDRDFVAADEAVHAALTTVQVQQANASNTTVMDEFGGRCTLLLQRLDVIDQRLARWAVEDDEQPAFDLIETGAGSGAALVRLGRDEERRREGLVAAAFSTASMLALEFQAEATERTDQETAESLLRRDAAHAEARAALETFDEGPARATIRSQAAALVGAVLHEMDIAGDEIRSRSSVAAIEATAFGELLSASARSHAEAGESRLRAIIADDELVERAAISSEHDASLSSLVGQAEEARRRFVRDVGLLDGEESRARESILADESASFDADLARSELHDRQRFQLMADEAAARSPVTNDQGSEATKLFNELVNATHHLQRSELESLESRARHDRVVTEEDNTRAMCSLESDEARVRVSHQVKEASSRALRVADARLDAYELTALSDRADTDSHMTADHEGLLRAVSSVWGHLGGSLLSAFAAHQHECLDFAVEPSFRAAIEQLEEPAAFALLMEQAKCDRSSQAIADERARVVDIAEPQQRASIVQQEYEPQVVTLRLRGLQLALLFAETVARSQHVRHEDVFRECFASGSGRRVAIMTDERSEFGSVREAYEVFASRAVGILAVFEAFAEAEEDARDEIINESADGYEAMYLIMLSDGELVEEIAANRRDEEFHAVEPEEEAARTKIDRKAYKALLKLNELHVSECGRIQALEEERAAEAQASEAPDLSHTATVSVAPRGGQGGGFSNASFGGGGGGGMLSDDEGDLGSQSPSNMSFGGPSVSGSIASAMSISVNSAMAADAKPVDDAVAKRIFGLMLNPPEAVVYNDGTLVIGMKLVVKGSDCGIAVIIKNRHATRQVFGVSFGMVSKPKQMHLRANARDIGSIPPGETRYVKVKASCRGAIDDGWPVIALRCTVVGGADVATSSVGNGDDATAANDGVASDAGDVGSQNSYVPSDNDGDAAAAAAGEEAAGARAVPVGIGPLSLSIPLPAGLPTFITPVVFADLKTFAATWKEISTAPSRTTESVRAQVTPACGMATLVSRAATRTSKLLHMHVLQPAEDTAALAGELHVSGGGSTDGAGPDAATATATVPIMLLIKGAINKEKSLCALRIEARSTTPNAVLEQVVAKQCAMLVRGNLSLANLRADEPTASPVKQQ